MRYACISKTVTVAGNDYRRLSFLFFFGLQFFLIPGVSDGLDQEPDKVLEQYQRAPHDSDTFAKLIEATREATESGRNIYVRRVRDVVRQTAERSFRREELLVSLLIAYRDNNFQRTLSIAKEYLQTFEPSIDFVDVLEQSVLSLCDRGERKNAIRLINLFLPHGSPDTVPPFFYYVGATFAHFEEGKPDVARELYGKALMAGEKRFERPLVRAIQAALEELAGKQKHSDDRYFSIFQRDFSDLTKYVRGDLKNPPYAVKKGESDPLREAIGAKTQKEAKKKWADYLNYSRFEFVASEDADGHARLYVIHRNYRDETEDELEIRIDLKEGVWKTDMDSLLRTIAP